jgi:hypothetical protein
MGLGQRSETGPKPVEDQTAFFFNMGLTITGGKVIHKYV